MTDQDLRGVADSLCDYFDWDRKSEQSNEILKSLRSAYDMGYKEGFEEALCPENALKEAELKGYTEGLAHGHEDAFKELESQYQIGFNEGIERAAEQSRLAINEKDSEQRILSLKLSVSGSEQPGGEEKK